MRNKMRKLCMGIILAVTLLGSSLTVMAADCLENGHSFTTTTRTYSHRGNENHHTHYDAGRGLRYSCTSYTYYYIVTQKCEKCGGVITIPGYEAQTVHVPN